MSIVQLSKCLKISQPTVSQSATRGEKIAKENKLKLLQNKQSMYQGMSPRHNRKRLHSSIDYCLSEEYERIEMKKAA